MYAYRLWPLQFQTCFQLSQQPPISLAHYFRQNSTWKPEFYRLASLVSVQNISNSLLMENTVITFPWGFYLLAAEKFAACLFGFLLSYPHTSPMPAHFNFISLTNSFSMLWIKLDFRGYPCFPTFVNYCILLFPFFFPQQQHLWCSFFGLEPVSISCQVP